MINHKGICLIVFKEKRNRRYERKKTQQQTKNIFKCHDPISLGSNFQPDAPQILLCVPQRSDIEYVTFTLPSQPYLRL